jgi:gluconate 2-dehydrogenase gamma chain
MHRRALLRLLGGASAIAAMPAEELFALGERTHAALRAETGPFGFFDAHQMQTVMAACDRIIPDTETPGAREAECHRFAERIVADHYDAPRQKRFLSGLVDLDQRSSRSAQLLFVDLAPPAQDEILAAVERDARASAQPSATFWRDLKYLTIYGYYTSRIGIQEELEVEFYPGRFDGCVPIGDK